MTERTAEYRKCEGFYDKNWADVELWRWQYGALPEQDDTRELDVMKGLGLMAEAVLTCECESRFNIAQAMMRGAFEIEDLRKRIKELEAQHGQTS